MIVQTVHDQGSSDRFKCPQCHCTKGSIDTGKGFMGFLTFLLLQPAIGWERCHQKGTKYQDLHPPLIAVVVLLLY